MKKIGKAGEPGDPRAASFLQRKRGKGERKRNKPMSMMGMSKGPGYATGGRVGYKEGGQPSYSNGEMPTAKPN